MSSAIVEKIKKLLSLANSPNENEARVATMKANELLVRYNLSLQEVKGVELSYEEFETEVIGKVLKNYHHCIIDLLQDYFFVRVIICSKRVSHYARSKFKRFKLVGTPENCEIASYVFAYLNRTYPVLWQEYKRDMDATARDKYSYYLGLTDGIVKMLKDTRWKIQEETGLVLVKDAGLEKYFNSMKLGSYSGGCGGEVNNKIRDDGFKDGLEIKLRKPITSNKNTTDQIVLLN